MLGVIMEWVFTLVTCVTAVTMALFSHPLNTTKHTTCIVVFAQSSLIVRPHANPACYRPVPELLAAIDL